MLSLIDKMTTGHEAGLASTAGVFDISEIMQCFTHVKSSSYFTVNQRQIERSLTITQIF